MLKKKKNNKGFTLVELLVVIAIIGILAVVAVPSLMSNLEKAKVSKLEGDYNVISTGVVTFYADYNEYPQVVNLVTAGDKTVNGVTTNAGTIKMSGYISEISNPFKASYELKYTAASGSGDSAKPEISELVITGIKMRESSVAKLETDLGKNKVKYSGTTLNIALVGEY